MFHEDPRSAVHTTECGECDLHDDDDTSRSYTGELVQGLEFDLVHLVG